MHSVSPPEEEANRLYIAQSRLAARLLRRTPDDTEPLVVWDVGLGAASNAMAALACAERELATHGAHALRPLHIVSFECDLDPLTLAARHASHFPHLRHRAPHTLLRDHRWTHPDGVITWTLHHGDFLAHLETSPSPDLVFYDPFSAKTDTGLWTTEVFARLHLHAGARPAELYTYSAATSVRVALLRAGWFVAEGVGTGPKASTTVAFTRIDETTTPHPARLLGPDFLTRWRRSHSQFPATLPEPDRRAFARAIETHPQFAAT